MTSLRVVLADNTGGYCPCDAAWLASMARRLGVRPVIVRVSPRHVQVYTAPLHAGKAEGFLAALGLDPWIPVHEEPSSLSRALERAWELAGMERYWEAHEYFEDSWRLGYPGGQLLAAAAGAVAKAQEGDVRAGLSIVWRQLPSIMNGQAGAGVKVDLQCLEDQVARAASCNNTGLATCASYTASLVSYRRK